MHSVCLEVHERELYNADGEPVTEDWSYVTKGFIDTPTKRALFLFCLKNFGRCVGLAPMGWIFEKNFTYDGGTKAFTQTRVKVVVGAVPPDGFTLI